MHKIYIYYNFYNKIVVTMKRTTIAVSPEIKTKVQRLGRKGESYEDILRRLLAIREAELKLIDEVYERIERTPRKEYVRLEDL